MDVSKIKLGEETYNIKDASISAWARAAAKPTYIASEVGALPSTTTIPTKTSDLTNDSGFIDKALYYGTCATAAATMPKVCTVETFPTFTDNGVTHAKDGTIIAVKFTYSDTNTEDAPALNVNGIGAKSIMYNNAIITSTSKNTTVAGTAKMLAYYRYNTSLDGGDGAWEYLGKSVDSNSTYSVLSASDLNTGTATTGRLVSAKLLREHFYTEDEVDTLLNAKLNTLTFDSTPTEDSTNPVTSDGIYTALDGFANNMSSVFLEKLVSGTSIKTVNGLSLLASGNIDTSELIFGYLSSGNFYISSGQSTILAVPNQEFLYIDKPTNKVYRYNGTSYVEINAVDSTITQNSTNPVLSSAIYNALTAKANSTDLAEVATSGDYDDLINKPTIPTVPTNVSSFTNDAGYLTSHQDISGKADKITVVEVSTSGAVSLALDANKFYKFTGTLTSLTITLTASNDFAIYAGKFTTNSSGCSLSVPNTVTVPTNVPAIEGGKSYEFSIMDNVLLLIEI